MWICSCGNQCNDEHSFCAKCGGKKRVKVPNNNPWYYIDNGVKVGPIPLENIRSFIDDGTITKDTFVWRKGLSDWTIASKTSLNSVLSTVVPPISKSSLHSKWIWCLATIPLFANLVLFLCLRPIPGTPDSFLLNAIVFLLNCLFLILDSLYLKNSGYNLKRSTFIGFVFVPIYLFIRAAKTNKNFGPAIVWCIFELFLLLPIW